MNFGFTPDQDALYEAARAVGREIGQDAIARDASGTFDLAGFRRCATLGVQGWVGPVAYGGRGLSHVTAVHGLEGLGFGCVDNGLTLALNSQIWAVQAPLQSFGTEDQKKRYLTGLIDGTLVGAHAMTEPHSGSDAFSLTATAEKVDGGYRLNGHKIYITLAPLADVFLVFASTNPAAGKWGLSAFLVDGTSAGCQATAPQDKLGMRTVPLSELHLDDCFVPDANLLGRPGSGLSIFNHTADYERSFILASHVGTMARLRDECVAFARERQQFGKPIGQFQSVSNRIADMTVRIETARLFLYKLAWMKDTKQPTTLESAMTNLQHSEAFVQTAMDAVRIHGGRGYLAEHGIERNLRDAIGSVLYSGTSDVQRNIVARVLGL